MKSIFNLSKGILSVALISVAFASCSEDTMDNINKDKDHTTSVPAKFILKGIGNFDPKKALEACVATANLDNYRGIGAYKELGYVPFNEKDSYNAENWSLSCLYPPADRLAKGPVPEPPKHRKAKGSTPPAIYSAS